MKKILMSLVLFNSINILSLDTKENKVFKHLSRETQYKIVKKKYRDLLAQAAYSYYFKIRKNEPALTISQNISIGNLENIINQYKKEIEDCQTAVNESTDDSFKDDIKPGIEAFKELLEALYDLQTIIKAEKLNL